MIWQMRGRRKRRMRRRHSHSPPRHPSPPSPPALICGRLTFSAPAERGCSWLAAGTGLAFSQRESVHRRRRHYQNHHHQRHHHHRHHPQCIGSPPPKGLQKEWRGWEESLSSTVPTTRDVLDRANDPLLLVCEAPAAEPRLPDHEQWSALPQVCCRASTTPRRPSARESVCIQGKGERGTTAGRG